MRRPFDRRYQHYGIFSSELSLHAIPSRCAGAVLYSYWHLDASGMGGYIDIKRLRTDLASGEIKWKRGFSTRTIDLLRQALLSEVHA